MDGKHSMTCPKNSNGELTIYKKILMTFPEIILTITYFIMYSAATYFILSFSVNFQMEKRKHFQ
jgi:hypothetical protein